MSRGELEDDGNEEEAAQEEERRGRGRERGLEFAPKNARMDGWMGDRSNSTKLEEFRAEENQSLARLPNPIEATIRNGERRPLAVQTEDLHVSQPNAWPCAHTLCDGLSAPNEADKLICWRTREEGRNTRQLGECRRKKGRGEDEGR